MNLPVQVSPSTNDITLALNQTFDEVVKVTIPKSSVVPKVDVYFLADTTGSMKPAITAVTGGILSVMTQIKTLGVNVWFGVGDYKDFPFPEDHPYAFTHGQSLTANIDQVKVAMDAWKTSAGNDTPEAQFYALDQVAEPPNGKIGWRADSKHIIVWFGDAASHDPSCQAVSKLSYHISEQSLIAKLVAEKITVVALSMNTNFRAPQGLDDDPKTSDAFYKDLCGQPGGTFGQGTRIAKATGGKLVQGVSTETIISTITAELAAQIAVFKNISLVANGATTPFVRAISPIVGYGPLNRDQENVISFDVSWMGTVAGTSTAQVFKGSLDIVADGQVIAGKPVTITVPAIVVSPPRPAGPYGRVPLIVELYDHCFTKNSLWGGDPGRRLLLSQDTPDLTLPFYMADTVTSLKIRPGPDFDPNVNYEVSFYRDPNYLGGQLVLKPGEYPDIHWGPVLFGDIMSSVKFNQGVPPAPPVTSIPIVAELYSLPNYAGRKLIILENVDNLGTYSAYDNSTYSVKVFKGPNYTPGDKIRLYDNFNGIGAYIELAPGDYPDLAKSHSFGYMTSSTRFLTGVGGSDPLPSGSMEYAKIPLIVELYDHCFTKNSVWGGDPGRRLLLVSDTPDLALPYQMADTVTSLKIRPGPNFDPNAKYQVSFYRDPNYIGGQLVLTPGEYPDIHFGPIWFGDIMSSVKFNQGVPPAAPLNPVPVVAELYSLPNYEGRKLIIFENVDNLATYSAYDNATYSIKVFGGPNYTSGDKIRLYDNINGQGMYIELVPGEYPDLQKSHMFANMTSSIRFVK